MTRIALALLALLLFVAAAQAQDMGKVPSDRRMDFDLAGRITALEIMQQQILDFIARQYGTEHAHQIVKESHSEFVARMKRTEAKTEEEPMPEDIRDYTRAIHKVMLRSGLYYLNSTRNLLWLLEESKGKK